MCAECRLGPPTIHPFNTPLHKETSGSKPCFPDDDEDCDVYSGNGPAAGIVIVPLQTTKSTASDDIVYVYKTQSGSREFKEASTLSATTLIHDRVTQKEIVKPITIVTSTTTTTETVPSESAAEVQDHRSHHELANTLATHHSSRTSEEARIKEQVMYEDGRNANSAYIEKLTMNIGLIIGIAIGFALLLLVLAFALYKYKSRNELPCNGNDTKGYVYETCNTLPPTPISTGPVVKTLASPAPQVTMTTAEKPKRRDVKEWYV